jgi:integrase/recombinase XerD
MPSKLSTTISKIPTIQNSTNSSLITGFHTYMKTNGASERHQNNSLKVLIAFAFFIEKDSTFYDIKSKDQIISFLDTKIKSQEQDPDKKWITTWNYYLVHVKRFFRWLYNHRKSKCSHKQGEEDDIPESEWVTPSFINIKKRRTKRVSPYSESEIWERDELLSIVKYEPYIRNKAALTLFWDLDARNHEIILLKIKNIRLRENYGEGDIPYQAKTGSGPILLTCSFPYVRDWLNEHPFKNSPEAKLICNLLNGSPIKPEAMWTMMKQLRERIIRMLKTGSITDEKERQKLEYLLKAKKWNPYCIRHSAITSDSDYLSGYGLNKKVRWSMNSKQPSRYIKSRMGNDLKKQILVHDGIIAESELQKKPSVLTCYRCNYVNSIDVKFCSKCSYPITPQAYDEIKEAENMKIQTLQQKYEQEMKDMREQMNQILSLIQQNPTLAQIKPEALIKKRVD